MAWERLAHAEITGSAGILTTGTFTAKKNLRVILYVTGLSVNNNTSIVFNDDNADNNYAIRAKTDNDNSYDHGSQPAVVLSPEAQDTSYTTMDITNVSGEIKQVFNCQSINTGGSGGGNAPHRRFGIAKWGTTSGQITKITVTDNNGGTGSITCGVGSYITVLGAKEPVTADTMTVSGFTAKKHLKVQMFANGTGGTVNCFFTFNNDTGSNYVIRESINGGNDTTNFSQSNTDNLTGTVTGNISAIVNITNESNKEKLFISDGVECATGAGASPDRKELVGKWTGSAQITTIKANNVGTGSYAEGSELIVWGSDGASDTIVTGALEDIVGGFVFEETNTGKHYIWNATTSTWTEIS